MSAKNNTCNKLSTDSVSYAVYLHRQELQRAKRTRRFMRVASTKLQLTNELIWLMQRNWLQAQEVPSFQQLDALDREREYRDLLSYNMQQQQMRSQWHQQQFLQAKLQAQIQEAPKMKKKMKEEEPCPIELLLQAVPQTNEYELMQY